MYYSYNGPADTWKPYSKEKVVSLQKAKLLKENGYSKPTKSFYVENHNAGEEYILVDYEGDGQFGVLKTEDHNNSVYMLNRYSAPTEKEASIFFNTL